MMDNLGNILTLLTLLGTIVLGISDIKRRRSEANKLDSDANLNSANRDTQIMSQIKQASVDLMLQLKGDNDERRTNNARLEEENETLKAKITELENKLRKFKQ